MMYISITSWLFIVTHAGITMPAQCQQCFRYSLYICTHLYFYSEYLPFVVTVLVRVWQQWLMGDSDRAQRCAAVRWGRVAPYRPLLATGGSSDPHWAAAATAESPDRRPAAAPVCTRGNHTPAAHMNTHIINMTEHSLSLHKIKLVHTFWFASDALQTCLLWTSFQNITFINWNVSDWSQRFAVQSEHEWIVLLNRLTEHVYVSKSMWMMTWCVTSNTYIIHYKHIKNTILN